MVGNGPPTGGLLILHPALVEVVETAVAKEIDESDGSNNVSAATAQPRVPMLSLSLSLALSRHAADRYASVTSAPILARS